jgi:hypothetical protein
MIPVRRSLLKGGAALGALIAAPALVRAQTPAIERRFAPQPGAWRTFDITTRVELADPVGASRIWLPVPSIDSDWQRSVDSSFTSNGSARMASDGMEGARMLVAEFPEGTRLVVEITSRVQTRSRSDLAGHRPFGKEDTATLPLHPCHTPAAHRWHRAPDRTEGDAGRKDRCGQGTRHLQLGR